jgi:hypothetical protein
MSKNQQGTFWALVAAAMVIISVWVINSQTNHKAVAAVVAVINKVVPKKTADIPASTTAPVAIATTTDQSVSTSTPPTTSPIYKRKSAAKTPALNYGEMVLKYASTRIQFNQLCQGIPGQEVMANAVTIMLDNRSDSAQKITILGKVYMVSAFNYVLVTLNQKVLPAQVSINCNGQMNASVVTLE